MPELWAMVLLGLACWVFRITFVLLPADQLPAVLLRGLEYLAPAVLAGIAAVELTAVVYRWQRPVLRSPPSWPWPRWPWSPTGRATSPPLSAVGLAAILLIDLVII